MSAIAETFGLKPQEALRVLLISDRQEVLGPCVQQMTLAGFDIAVIGHSDAAIEILRQQKPSLTVVDLSRPNTTGLEVLECVQREKLGTALIAVSRDGSLDWAVKAMKLGAFDYLPEPFDNDRLISAMYAALGRSAPTMPFVGKDAAAVIEKFKSLAGLSSEIRGLSRVIVDAGTAARNVLLTGASGIGRDICARAIHACSSRRHQPFVTISCAALPKALIESELFGHAKGAFPGAVTERAGLATEAHGGTLLVDEICDLDPHVQTQLLQLVRYGTFQRVGHRKLEQVDLRIVGTTSRSPDKVRGETRLQEALLDSLEALPIDLPALWGNDIMQLSRLFLSRKLPAESKSHEAPPPEGASPQPGPGGPGNARDLQKALQHAMGPGDDQRDDSSLSHSAVK